MRITAPCEISLMELLHRNFPETSATKLKKIIQCGCVRHNNAVVKHPEFVLSEGDTIEYTKYEAKRTYRERTSVPILYEDGTIVASFKASGTPLTGKTTGGIRSLNNSLNADLSRQHKGSVAVTPVMSLRVEENGICVFCKRDELRRKLQETCAKAIKHYRVWVCGTFENTSGELTSWAQLNFKGFLRQWKDEPDENTVQCDIKYTVARAEKEITLLDIEMIQIFENQLCMQLSHSGYPVLGDKQNTLYKVDYPFPYTFNYRLEIPHPANGKPLILTTSLPDFFTNEKNDKKTVKKSS
ncbi:MAG: hypothetical protein J5605_01055 [Bacteroidales bacterium]|nr:hypothetical protein [Bacteroidales bacterium]